MVSNQMHKNFPHEYTHCPLQPTFSVNNDRTTHLLSQASSIGIDHLEKGLWLWQQHVWAMLNYVKHAPFEVFAPCD